MSSSPLAYGEVAGPYYHSGSRSRLPLRSRMGKGFLRLKFRLGLESRVEQMEHRIREVLKDRALIELWQREVPVPWLLQENFESAPPSPLEDQEECVVCMDFVPCGHVCCCRL